MVNKCMKCTVLMALFSCAFLFSKLKKHKSIETFDLSSQKCLKVSLRKLVSQFDALARADHVGWATPNLWQFATRFGTEIFEVLKQRLAMQTSDRNGHHCPADKCVCFVIFWPHRESNKEWYIHDTLGPICIPFSDRHLVWMSVLLTWTSKKLWFYQSSVLGQGSRVFGSRLDAYNLVHSNTTKTKWRMVAVPPRLQDHATFVRKRSE